MRSPVEIVTTVPTPLRIVARNAIWAFGSATSALRPLPDFLIVGAQKAGTTSLYSYLRRHPGISGPFWKEVSFFDRHYARGIAWYRGHFPTVARHAYAKGRHELDLIVGEASPSYLFHPLAPERVAALLPDVRLIALLRDPVERAFSHYNHEVALGREALSFEDALAREEERMRGELERMEADQRYFSAAWWTHTYLARGRYVEQLERWLAVFPRERLLVLASEKLSTDPGDTYARALEFLGAAPHALDSYPRLLEREYGAMRPETREQLGEYFSEPNRRLVDLLGRDFDWTQPAPLPTARRVPAGP
jgi:hypothetical protein